LYVKIAVLAAGSGFSVSELFGTGRGLKGGKVAPKYMNPDNNAETWTGRGRQPRWLVAKLAKGAKLEQLHSIPVWSSSVFRTAFGGCQPRLLIQQFAF
jgi:hypothetical protein